MRTGTRTTVIAAATGLALAATVTTTLAALDDDGVHLQAAWANGGHAWLELEDENVVPVICFVWRIAVKMWLAGATWIEPTLRLG